ncbi:aminotransferase class III-fold pyridoxal phosphate-dependent enzyme [Microbispora sp. NPDC049125]|uniref:aminotransferase class III-fold pyridoxal phosphate-dependent enzyme n=1 Tax=Microbispora sp. NPDC049125 TaxID=3154929 RepID=UPI003465FE43
MTARTAAATDEMIAGLLGEQWIIDLFTDLGERQATSAGLADRLRRGSVSNHVLWPFHAPQFPLAVTRAEGCRITDADGNVYLDAHLGFGAQALHGHNPGPVADFVRGHLGTQPGNGYFHPLELGLTDLLRTFVPHCEKFAFLNSGTDATAAAIRLARAHTGRRMVAKFEGALHGVHDIAAHNTAFWYHGHPVEPFPPIDENGVRPLPALTGLPPVPDLLILPNDADQAAALIERHAGELACVLGEAVSSSFPYAERTVPVIRRAADVCAALRIPFVLDEVLTGFRYGPGGAATHFGIHADLYCYGKVISGLGIPLSAVGGDARMLEHAQTSGMALTDLGRKTCVQTTHAGNTLALAASFASLSLLRDKGDAYYARTRAKVDRIRARLGEFRAETGIPLRLLGFGDFIGSFGFVAEDDYPGYREFADAVDPIAVILLTLMLRRRGVYMLSLPMLFTGDAHSDADIDELLTAVTGAARDMDANGYPWRSA